MTLTPRKRGGFSARKRIPEDVREEYGRLYGSPWEARFVSTAARAAEARREHRMWLDEIETRIANIRAARSGEGVSLSRMQARALAGEWYRWWVGMHTSRPSPLEGWEAKLDDLRDALRRHAAHESQDDPDHDLIWERIDAAREEVRPMLADWGETAQFLAAKRLVLSAPSRVLFLDNLYADFSAALRLLIRHAEGDFRPDSYPERFPALSAADAGLSFTALFREWIEAKKPAVSTVDRWRGVFLDLDAHFRGRSAGSLLPEEAQTWADGLAAPDRSAKTVRDVWVRAASTVCDWAVKAKRLNTDPFSNVHITVPKKASLRPTKAFTDAELKTILTAARAVTDTSTATAAARRWVPWLCAYTGARPGEITQLRGEDVFEQDGVFAIRITPEAGTVKTQKAREVPLHADLVAQGFPGFVKARGTGPLFYNARKAPPEKRDSINPAKPLFVKAREHLATWVRKQGVTDREVSPNHGWRHSFKQIAGRHDLPERVVDYICGHAPATVGRGYGTPTLADMARIIARFPKLPEQPEEREAQGPASPNTPTTTTAEGA